MPLPFGFHSDPLTECELDENAIVVYTSDHGDVMSSHFLSARCIALKRQSMSFHDNYEEWQRMTEAQNCPVCSKQQMPQDMVDIVELANSWLSAEPVECLEGTCHLVAKKHVVELYELNDEELLSLMQEVQICARALKTVTHAVKINYEIHGNTVPHLHIHFYPRHRDDPFPGRAIDYSQRKNWYAEGEFESFVARMREEIAASCSEP